MLLDTSGLLPKKADMAEPSVKNCELWVEVGFFPARCALTPHLVAQLGRLSCDGMKAAAPAVPKTGTAEKKSIKREGRRTPIRTVLLGGASLCAFGGLACLLQVAGQHCKNRLSGRCCDACEARMQLGRQSLRDVCRINLDTVMQQGRLMEWQVFCYTDRFFPCLSFSCLSLASGNMSC